MRGGKSVDTLLFGNTKVEISFFKRQFGIWWWKHAQNVALISVLEQPSQEHEIGRAKEICLFMRDYLNEKQISADVIRIAFVPLRGEDTIYEFGKFN
jgi:hypothetical protein